MDKKEKFTNSAYWGKLGNAEQEYIMMQLEYLELKGKSFGIDQNIHVYKDKNGNMDQGNLICYVVIDKNDFNILELRTHNPGAQDKNGKPFTGADHFYKLKTLSGTKYNLNDKNDIYNFSSLILKISNI